jgi:hypothetical protein
VWYNQKVILSGNKDPSTDLWKWSINSNAEKVPNSIEEPTSASSSSQRVCPPPKKRSTMPSDAHNGVPHVASFTHSVKTRANGVKFTHQSLCNPKISTLLKAVRRGFLDGCPNLSEKLIHKYLNACSAMAKGHMKRPRHGIHSTTPKTKNVPMIQPTVNVTNPMPNIPPQLIPNHLPRPPVMHNTTMPNLIGDDEDNASLANNFLFWGIRGQTKWGHV